MMFFLAAWTDKVMAAQPWGERVESAVLLSVSEVHGHAWRSGIDLADAGFIIMYTFMQEGL
jgi:hypothetical protein